MCMVQGASGSGKKVDKEVGVEVVATRNKMWMKMWIKTYSTVSSTHTTVIRFWYIQTKQN